MKDIAVAVALYNNEKEVIEFTKGLLRQSIVDRIQLLITCNECKDIEKFSNAIHDILPSTLIFDPKLNLGYLNGCLYGVKESGSSYSWIMVSNTDIEFKEKDFFEKAIQNVSKDTWCIGPDIVLSATGIHQNPFLLQRPSKKKLWVWRTAYSDYMLFWLYFKLSALKPKKTIEKIIGSRNVYAVHGSCFLLRNECVEKMLPVCKNIFMYGEELLIAEIVFQNKKSIYCNMSIGIIHNENQVTGSVGMKRKQKWFKNSIDYLSCNIYKM